MSFRDEVKRDRGISESYSGIGAGLCHLRTNLKEIKEFQKVNQGLEQVCKQMALDWLIKVNEAEWDTKDILLVYQK